MAHQPPEALMLHVEKRLSYIRREHRRETQVPLPKLFEAPHQRVSQFNPWRSDYPLLHQVNHSQQQDRLMRSQVPLNPRRMQRGESLNVWCQSVLHPISFIGIGCKYTEFAQITRDPDTNFTSCPALQEPVSSNLSPLHFWTIPLREKNCYLLSVTFLRGE